ERRAEHHCGLPTFPPEQCRHRRRAARGPRPCPPSNPRWRTTRPTGDTTDRPECFCPSLDRGGDATPSQLSSPPPRVIHPFTPPANPTPAKRTPSQRGLKTTPPPQLHHPHGTTTPLPPPHPRPEPTTAPLHPLDHTHDTTTAPPPHRPRPGTPTGTAQETDLPPPIKEEAPPHVSAARHPAVVYVLRVWPALRARAEQWLLCREPADTAPDRAPDPVRGGPGNEQAARLRRSMATPVTACSPDPAVVLQLWTS